jgi:uncharacterized protein YxeA
MLKKPVIKIILATILLIISLIFIIKNIDRGNISKSTKTANSKTSSTHNSNIIEDLNYTSKDLQGNEYNIFAKEGEIDLKNTDIIFLKNVTAYIKLQKKSEVITIISDYGKYNSINYDTIFSKNVKIKYLENIITSEYLDFSMIKNLMIISKNVIYKSPENILNADVVEVDIRTKDTKIFMYDTTDKINIKSVN